ncbi:MAG: hypothetical protein QOJ02_1387 [Acidobacteriota bacterium]|nr:hypothetical protein [Acidobacteriota bacterium]
MTRAVWKACAALCMLFLMVVAVYAQSPDGTLPDNTPPLVVEGVNTSDVFGWGQSVVVRGTIKHGVMAFGGDVIVEGVVEGDVATVGGSVVQRDGSQIGGDVIVIGGSYRHGASAASRNPASATVMFTGFEPELRNVMRNPASLLAPQWSLVYLGSRVMAVLFWFIAALMLTAVTPGAVSRAVMRLQLTNVRVGIIGFVGSIVMTFGVVAGLSVLPTVIAALVGLAALILILLAYLFGRVAIQAATGQWLQRKCFGEKYRSESVALLCGTMFWAILLSVPYIWPFVGAGLLVASLGLALTARYRVGWKRP